MGKRRSSPPPHPISFLLFSSVATSSYLFIYLFIIYFSAPSRARGKRLLRMDHISSELSFFYIDSFTVVCGSWVLNILLLWYSRNTYYTQHYRVPGVQIVEKLKAGIVNSPFSFRSSSCSTGTVLKDTDSFRLIASLRCFRILLWWKPKVFMILLYRSPQTFVTWKNF